jgi:hypothetical protein
MERREDRNLGEKPGGKMKEEKGGGDGQSVEESDSRRVWAVGSRLLSQFASGRATCGAC